MHNDDSDARKGTNFSGTALLSVDQDSSSRSDSDSEAGPRVPRSRKSDLIDDDDRVPDLINCDSDSDCDCDIDTDSPDSDKEDALHIRKIRRTSSPIPGILLTYI